MRLSRSQKDTLLQSANSVYFSFLALDFFKNKLCSIESHDLALLTVGVPETVLSFIERNMRCIRHKPTMTISIEGSVYQLNISLAPGICHRYRVTLSSSEVVLPRTKVPNDYTDEEAVRILANRTFVIDNLLGCDQSVALMLSSEYEIGGSKKIDLYRTHLVTLSNIINKIHQEEDISCLLVALATGSGKTYVQALLLALLNMAKFNAVFALPDKLIAQLKKDWHRILPDAMLDRILTLRDHEDAALIAAKMQQFQSSSQTLMVASSELLLDQCYDSLSASSPDQTCLILDEQHLLMAHERRRLRLLTLSQRFLSVFLTATPNQETYQMSGAKPVAIMSSGQKQKAGQGRFPNIITLQSQSAFDLHRQQTCRFGSVAYWRKQCETLIFHFDEAIQSEQCSAIRTVFDELPYVVQRDEQESDLRWRIQVPMASKILCIIDDNEALVNCCHALQASEQNVNAHNIYHKGNFLERSSVSYFFGIPDVSQALLNRQKESRTNQYLAAIQSDEEREYLEAKPKMLLQQQLKSNMFHYLVEYVLSDITGKSMIEHHYARKESANKFKDTIVSQYQYRNKRYFYERLLKEIDEEGAQIISPLLEGISYVLGKMRRTNNQDAIRDFTDNWFLKDYMIRVSSELDWFDSMFQAYAQCYLVLGIMSGMNEAETPVQNSKPFLGFNEDRYPLYANASGLKNVKAKRRLRTSIELLDNQAHESNFTPNYISITEDQADAYFRLGFVGMYVSNKKTEGFNDPNLHTIINAVEHSLDANNIPFNLTQGLGRARGVDMTVSPNYFYSLGRQQSISFDLRALTMEDYYPDLFIAQKRFERKYIAVLGEQLGQDIIAWYHQHQERDETINADQLKRKILFLMAEALRRLNIQSDQRIHIARALLPQVITHTMTKLDKEIAHTKQPYHLSLFLRMIGSMVNFICECYFALLRFKPWLAMLWHSLTFARASQTNPEALRTARADKLYMKILRQTHFKDLTAQGLVAVELKAWLVRKATATKDIVEKSLRFYLNPEIKQQVDKHLETTVFPMFEKMVIPGKVARVRERLQQYNGMLYFLRLHQETLQSLSTLRTDEEFAELMLELFHQIPGLEGLCSTDIVNYPRRMQQHLDWFMQPPLHLVTSDPALKISITETLTTFMTNELPNYIPALMTYPDQMKMLSFIQEPVRIRAFVDHYLNQVRVEPMMPQNMTQVFACFREFFACPTIELLPEKLMQTKANVEAYQLSCIADLVYRELLPCMVNFYPLETRERLLAQIFPEAIEGLLRSRRTDIQELMNRDDALGLTQFFFTHLCTNVPEPIEVSQIKMQAKRFFDKQLTPSAKIKNSVRTVSDFLLKNTIGIDPGLMRTHVQTLLLKPECMQILSSLLPFHHWKILHQRFIAEPERLAKLADSLLLSRQNRTELSPEIFIGLINVTFSSNYRTTQDYAATIGGDIKLLSAGERTVCTLKHEHKLAVIVRQDCLPLLACYLPTENLKRRFLATGYSDQTLCDAFVTHFANLQKIGDLDAEQQKQIAYVYIQRIHPGLVEANDLIDPKAHAVNQGKRCHELMLQRIKTVCVMSEVCKDKLLDFFNPEDADALRRSLTQKSQAEFIVDAVLPNTTSYIEGGSAASQKSHMQDADLDQILATVGQDLDLSPVRTSISGLQDIEFLHVRLKQLSTNILSILDMGVEAVDTQKLIDVLSEQVQPVLVHPEFRHFLNIFMGSLTENELQLIFESHGKPNPQEIAKRLLRFKAMINQFDIVAFKQEFMQCQAGETYDFERSSLKLVLEDFAILAEEVMHCHCYYQQHDIKGEQMREGPKPGIFIWMSDKLKGIRIPAFDNFLSHFSRKVFFVQGIRNGLPKAGQVYADSQKHLINNLQRVNRNLLRPLWWTVNSFHVVYRILDTVKTWFFLIKDWLYKCLAKITAVVRRILGLPPVSVSLREGIAMDYTEAAFETAKGINRLTPLTIEQVADGRCPRDVITELERDIARLPRHRLRLFQILNARGDRDLGQVGLGREYIISTL